MNLLFVSGIVVALIVIAVILRSSSRRRASPRFYVQLIKLTGGDDEQADRLLDAERKRHPGLSRERLALLAIKRWEKDRGR